MRLDRSQRSTGLGGDLGEGQFTEEAKGDNLAIGVVKPADGRSNPCRPLRAQRGDRGILAAGDSDRGGGRAGVDPRDVAPALRSAESDADGDPREPGPKRTVVAPTGEAPEGDHERLLGCVLGLMEITEDAVAGADDRRGFVLDEDSERVPIACQDSLDNGAFIDDRGADVRRLKR
jgi:hypothetical protein